MMRIAILFTIVFIICITSAFGQKQFKGVVKDNNGIAISSANVNLKDAEGNILSFTRSNEKGEFTIIQSSDSKEVNIEATSIGYEKQMVKIADFLKNNQIVMNESNISLKTVVVKNRPTLTLNGDTLNYKTSDFADKQDRSIGDVIKKMPGITVEENGRIKYNDKPISSLYVDGDNILDDKYAIGTKSIPHGAVDKVQVIEKDQPIKMLRKNNMSDDVALNLVIKDDAKLKVMGDIKVGLGTPNRFDANANAMMFKKKIKFINNLKGNNIGIDPGIDLTSFNLEDYLKRLENDKPSGLLSAGAAGVPTLPQSRTLFNKAGLINFNNLYKINDVLQLKVNLAYLYDVRTQEYNKLSETYLSGQTISYTEQQLNSIKPQKLQSKFNLLANADDYYFNNTLILNYSPSFINSEVITNGNGAQQSLRQSIFDVSNELNYRKKLKSENTFNLYSYINRTTQPERLNISPGLNEDILNNGNPYAGLTQYVKLPSLYTNNYTSFAFVNNAFTQTYKIGFNIQQQELNSELYRIQNNSNTELVAQSMTNNLDWLKTKLYTDATYDYNSGKVKATLNLPISYNFITYKDEEKALDKDLSKFFVNPSLNIKYQIGIENYMTANYSFKNDLGGIDDIYRGTILKNYRSLFSNNAPISERKTQAAGLSFNYKKAIQMVFFNAALGYSNSTRNTISSYTLSNNIQERIVLPLVNDVKSFNSSVSGSKYLFDLRTTVNAGLGYSDSKFDQLQNNELLPFTSQNTTYKTGFESKLTSYINWSYNASFNINKTKSKANDALETKNKQLRHQSSVTATIFKSLFMTVSAEHIFTKQVAQPNLNYVFADLNLRYKLIKLKTDLEFSLTNIANVTKFEANFISVNSFTSGTYYIPGRVAMVKATFNF
ncbi:carboxypeptidase-like regulatory domain-containing protein [Pedobacter aquatilis]|uniref:carboxypeptidase-like regulatory domain-containing protein n=1 Tax=Pedobacter aquatilis TaxID=351343 RepID=UPI002930086F|nr:carboxypeptidase-like regulatory domain-containing protein [Pedobacter aquatilis]